MPKFAYKALDKEGKKTFGVIEADTQALAINDIRHLGLYPTKLSMATKADERRAIGGRRIARPWVKTAHRPG